MSDAYDRLVYALEAHGSRVIRNRAQCPAHGSRGLTLALRDADDRVMIHCHAGCDPHDVAATVGLTMGDLFDGERPAGYVPPPPRAAPSPWDPITRGPGVEHVMGRMLAEQLLEADPGIRDRARAQGEDCAPCAHDEQMRDLRPPDAAAAVWVRCVACGATDEVAQWVLEQISAGTRVPCSCGGELR